jgi:hypothetical protein
MEAANLLHSSNASIVVTVLEKIKLTWRLQPFGVIDAHYEVWLYLLFNFLIFHLLLD